jgi:hypothetical protein
LNNSQQQWQQLP